MKRKTKPKSKKDSTISDDKKKIKKIVKSLSTGDWNSDERETSILFDYSEKMVYLETSYGPTARRWFKNLWGDPDVKWDTKADTLKCAVPWDYCRKADLILKHKHRSYER